MNDKALNLLGLARRANLISIGFDSVKSAIKSQKSTLILFAADLSNRTKEQVENLAKPQKIATITTSYTAEDFFAALGKRGAIISVNDEGFTTSIKKILNT